MAKIDARGAAHIYVPFGITLDASNTAYKQRADIQAELLTIIREQIEQRFDGQYGDVLLRFDIADVTRISELTIDDAKASE